jgi:hypothetical protein
VRCGGEKIACRTPICVLAFLPHFSARFTYHSEQEYFENNEPDENRRPARGVRLSSDSFFRVRGVDFFERSLNG